MRHVRLVAGGMVARYCSGEPCTDTAALCGPSAGSPSDAYAQAYVQCVSSEGSNLDDLCSYASGCVVDAKRRWAARRVRAKTGG